MAGNPGTFRAGVELGVYYGLGFRVWEFRVEGLPGFSAVLGFRVGMSCENGL